MTIMAPIVFLVLLVVAPAVIWATSGALPERVATHFGHDGFANGFMTRDGYRLFMLALGTLVPLLVVTLTGLAPRFAHWSIKMPDPGYWLAPERRAETLRRMRDHAYYLGIAMLVFFMAMHFLTLRANAASPPRLPEGPFYALVVGLVLVVIVWVVALRLRFRKP